MPDIYVAPREVRRTMSNLVPPADIEEIVGIARHRTVHMGRAESAQQTVYILHSQACLDSGIDLRECRFSIALDKGIRPSNWDDMHDIPVALGVWGGRIVPIKNMAGA